MPNENPESAPGAAQTCWSCGTVNKFGARFCRSCGASIDSPRPVEPQHETITEHQASPEPAIIVEKDVPGYALDSSASANAVSGDNRKPVGLIAGIVATLVLVGA